MVDLKRCDCCIAMLPISDFGKSRSAKDFLNATCRSCIRELGRHKYALKFGHVHTDALTTGNYRIVRLHNITLLDHAMSNTPTTLYGFVPHTDLIFKIYIGASSALSTHNCMRLTLQGVDVPAQEFAYDPATNLNVVPTLLLLLKQLSIRLERTEPDMLDSKQSIYYIGLL